MMQELTILMQFFFNWQISHSAVNVKILFIKIIYLLKYPSSVLKKLRKCVEFLWSFPRKAKKDFHWFLFSTRPNIISFIPFESFINFIEFSIHSFFHNVFYGSCFGLAFLLYSN
jgi:hypothetical protein